MIRFIIWLASSLLTYGVVCFLLTLLYAVFRLSIIHRMMWSLYLYWLKQLKKQASRLIPNVEMQVDIKDLKAPYLIISNHYSWLDILLIYMTLIPAAPGFVFVMKRSLIKMPMIGIICWGLGHPMMRKSRKRYQGKLRNHLALEASAKEAARHGYGIMIFPEGTRYNIYKELPKTKYAHLLNPKHSGFSILYEALKPVPIIDITLSYEKHEHTIMDFLRGRTGAVKVFATQHDVKDEAIESWLQNRWQKKDDLLRQIQHHPAEAD